MSLEKRKLRTTYPCCGGSCQITALMLVPSERYERKCSRCGTFWSVLRTRLVTSTLSGCVMDKLEWERS
jgi:hypothetical protein